MDQSELYKFRKLLKEEKSQLLETIRLINAGGLEESMKESIGELSMYDNNPADIGSELFERSKDFALRENAKLEIKAIDDALSRTDGGKYGICEVCGVKISLERLKAVPRTTVCYSCSLAEEKKSSSSIRPVEEEVLDDIYKKSFSERTENVEYDMEDAWQDVTRYTEHAEKAGAGAYYGNNELDMEDRGYVEDVENIAAADISGNPIKPME